jgi:NAD(P)-dependent dehydrogenase (short-subunit alcohol dehydrogenase family)
MLRNKWLTPPKEATESFVGRNVLITGATSGLGHAAAAKFAKLGATKVIIPARDVARGEQSKAELEALVGQKGQFEVWHLDMNSYDSIVTFAHRAATELDHLDIAVLNAGVRKVAHTLSKHGWEEDLQVNVLSTMLLSILLLPKLKESKKHTGMIPILEFVNSGFHATADVPQHIRNSPSILAEYNKPERFNSQRQYVHSKLLLMFATNRLAAATSSSEVIITSVCPGVVVTNLARDVKVPGISIVLAIMRVTVARTAEQGANTYVSGAAQDQKMHGRFWKNDSIQPIGQSIMGQENEQLAVRVWEEILEDLVKHVPEARQIVSVALAQNVAD